MHKFALFLVGLFLVGLSVLPGCRKDRFNTDPSFRLHFSTDTLSFDTLFTSLGSTTAVLKVYNNSSLAVDIQHLELVGGQASFFRINVDGDTSLLQSSVRLAGNDSLFIFITLTVAPNQEDLPFEIWDYLRLVTHAGTQEVVLKAWGQNAIFHLPTDVFKIPYEKEGKIDTLHIPYSIADCSSPWTAGKPHVIYGYLLVDTNDVLSLEAGCRLHFAPNAGLWIYNGGSLQVNGDLGNEVRFEGMRFDEGYKDLPAQWDRIWLSAGSKNNRINYAIIRNGTTGLWIDGNEEANVVDIRNSIIHNMQKTGIWSQGASLSGENLQVSNCGEHLVALTQGGNYTFEHCTFANYFRYSNNQSYRKKASVLLDNYDLNENTGDNANASRPLIADFNSCIIYGSLQEELQENLHPNRPATYRFDYCNLRTQWSINTTTFTNCQINIPPGFKDERKGNFDLRLPSNGEASGCIAKGKPGPTGRLQYDLLQRRRAYFPSIGAYEFTEE